MPSTSMILVIVMHLVGSRTRSLALCPASDRRATFDFVFSVPARWPGFTWHGPRDISLEIVRAERVPLCEVAGLESLSEPADPLLRSSVRERVGHHVALRLTLQSVVADRGGRSQAVFNVALFQDLAFLMQVVRPDPGQKIGLKLESN